MSPGLQAPSPAIVQKILRTTTERLARELADPTDSAPEWTDVEWRAARAAAAIHGVGPLLATTLRWRGPPGWNAFLIDQRRHTEIRHQRIEALTRLMNERARRINLPMVALKGAALHAMGVYRPGERPMADLDLLVRNTDLPSAQRLIEEQDFREQLLFWKNQVFVPNHAGAATCRASHLGEHHDNPIKIELHWRIHEKLPFALTDVTDFCLPTDAHPGLNSYPTRAALLMHLVLHAAGSMAGRDLRLIHLHDLSLICARMQADDWKVILQHGRQGNGPWWFFPPLRLAAHYYPGLVPGPVLARFERACPGWLEHLTRHRTLTDVSLSSVWISAFPGIAWSQSLAEAALYIFRRLRPDADAHAVREVDAASAAWADDRWSGLSQHSRVIRWMVSRPPRPATMHVFHSALRQSV
jgi:hypothetical protein